MVESRFFSKHELECKCGCGKGYMLPDFLTFLDAVRDEFGSPIILVSAYRCALHNAECGGVPHSLHMRGMAVDISAPPGKYLFPLVSLLIKYGATGIGFNLKGNVAGRFIHVEKNPELTNPPRTMWSY
jgi:uncharacterized protein YcbK (DUF882 family)